jgi:lipoate-protein ligase A
VPVVRLEGLDPFLNCAIEEQLLADGGPDPLLLLWRSRPSVVIGRNQNPWRECDLPRMADADVVLVRRITGGGAVYHDPGNLNFSFIAPQQAYDQHRQFDVVLDALAALRIEVVLNERNDLVVCDSSGRTAKISGNAFRHTRGRSLHHGTLLIDADLSRLHDVLRPTPSVMTTAAITSVRSRVINLSSLVTGAEPVTVERLSDALERTFLTRSHEPPRGRVHRALSPDVLAADDRVVRRRQELAGWDWRYGHTPPFTTTMTAVPGCGELALEVRKGRIVSVRKAILRPGNESPVGIDSGEACEILSRIDARCAGLRYTTEDLTEAGRAESDDAVREAVLFLAKGI